jgi:protein SCO1/2
VGHRVAAELICLALIAALVLAGSAPIVGLPRAWAAGVTAPAFGGSFAMTDHLGNRMTEADYRGRYLLIFFGYTFCPDVCPTGLQAMSIALDMLGARAEGVTPIFVSLDPERDTPAILADYVESFHPRLVGLTGSVTEVKSMARLFFVRYYKLYMPPPTNADDNAKEVDDNSRYLINHSSATYLVGPDGKGLSILPHGVTPEAIAAAIERHVGLGKQ